MPGLRDRLVQALDNITTLEVTTRVGDLTIEVPPSGDPKITVTKGDFKSGAYTRIDLVDGDTFNNLTPDMLDAAHAELRAFHQQAVRDAQGLVDKRLLLIQQAAEWLGGKVKDLIQRDDTPVTDDKAKSGGNRESANGETRDASNAGPNG